MTDDPYTFGKIAAANALSDVYAMGGKPLLALNLTCFPEDLPLEAVGEILRGGAEKLTEAGAVLAGGHSIYGDDVKYGLSVTGTTTRQNLQRNNTPASGHKLILTKALGTGIVMSASNDGFVSDEITHATLNSMQRLNKYAAEKLEGFNVSACTDITGFGLIGHALEMAGENASIVFYADKLPLLPGVLECAANEYITGGGVRNFTFAGDNVNFGNIPVEYHEICFDPQTSGGLLIAVDPGQAEELLLKIQQDDKIASIIGCVGDASGVPKIRFS